MTFNNSLFPTQPLTNILRSYIVYRERKISKHLITVIKIHLILAKVGEFSAFDSINGGCVTGCSYNSVGVSGCSGKMVVTPSFKRGNIE